MISSELVNELFKGLSKFISKITHREIKFQEINKFEVMAQFSAKVNKFFEDATEALGNPSMHITGDLQPGKIYCMQVDKHVDWDWLDNMADALAKKDILFVVINEHMKFVNTPEGYEIKKKENIHDL